MESRVMHNRLQVSFTTVEGAIAIAAALLIVIAVDKSESFFARISMFLRGPRSFPVTVVPRPVLTDPQISGQMDRPPKALSFSMESHAMHNRLQFSFWGLHPVADGSVIRGHQQ
jgi:hypothetical protein